MDQEIRYVIPLWQSGGVRPSPDPASAIITTTTTTKTPHHPPLPATSLTTVNRFAIRTDCLTAVAAAAVATAAIVSSSFSSSSSSSICVYECQMNWCHTTPVYYWVLFIRWIEVYSLDGSSLHYHIKPAAYLFFFFFFFFFFILAPLSISPIRCRVSILWTQSGP